MSVAVASVDSLGWRQEVEGYTADSWGPAAQVGTFSSRTAEISAHKKTSAKRFAPQTRAKTCLLKPSAYLHRRNILLSQ